MSFSHKRRRASDKIYTVRIKNTNSEIYERNWKVNFTEYCRINCLVKDMYRSYNQKLKLKNESTSAIYWKIIKLHSRLNTFVIFGKFNEDSRFKKRWMRA